MNPQRIVLEIITPDGRTFQEQGIDVLIVRRREMHFEQGSEVAIFPSHGPMLIRLPISPLRYRKGVRTVYLVVEGGFIEVKNNHVLLMTPRFEEIGREEQAQKKRAHQIAAQWRDEHKEFRKEIVGYIEAARLVREESMIEPGIGFSSNRLPGSP